MERDLDNKLYNNYLNGEKQVFEYLYNKYKNKIEYFIYNIIKDYPKAEDITQETFIYVAQNKMKENCSFKYYIYLVAKSKAYNYINVEKRRSEINEQYMLNQEEKSEKDVLEIITREENRKELLESIEQLEEKYKNAIYLTKIEGLTCEETAKILGQTLSNTKTLIYRGKKQLRKVLLKKGFDDMNKSIKIMIIILITTVSLTGIAYAVTQIYKNFNTNHKITINPTYQTTIEENTVNNLWIGTLDLAWKELAEKIGKEKIEIIDEEIQIVSDLNASTFTKDMLESSDYEINVERTVTNGYKIEATLKKELNFLAVFDNFSQDYRNKTFGDGTEYIKYFGINNASPEKMNKNIEILFYNKESNNSLYSNDFAIKLKTKEGDEIILYRTNENKSFDEYYKEIQEQTKKYTGNKEFLEDDRLLIPYVRVNGMICYNELYGKPIKGTKGLYIDDVIQEVNFSLNEKGCNLSGKATMVAEYLGMSEKTRYCYFQNQFIIFMKEAYSETPYFALKVDNDDILEKIEENNEPKLLDYTMMRDNDRYKIEPGEYKFYEDENYEYYYPTQKTKVVKVYFENGDFITAEQALKEGRITIDLLDKYEVKYIKKQKQQ